LSAARKAVPQQQKARNLILVVKLVAIRSPIDFVGPYAMSLSLTEAFGKKENT
jgi:hypothetical protein